MVNVNKLKAKIVETGLNVEGTAERAGMNKATLYRRLCKPEEITIGEADRLTKALQISGREAISIFFSQLVAQNATNNTID